MKKGIALFLGIYIFFSCNNILNAMIPAREDVAAYKEWLKEGNQGTMLEFLKVGFQKGIKDDDAKKLAQAKTELENQLKTQQSKDDDAKKLAQAKTELENQLKTQQSKLALLQKQLDDLLKGKDIPGTDFALRAQDPKIKTLEKEIADLRAQVERLRALGGNYASAGREKLPTEKVEAPGSMGDFYKDLARRRLELQQLENRANEIAVASIKAGLSAENVNMGEEMTRGVGETLDSVITQMLRGYKLEDSQTRADALAYYKEKGTPIEKNDLGVGDVLDYVKHLINDNIKNATQSYSDYKEKMKNGGWKKFLDSKEFQGKADFLALLLNSMSEQTASEKEFVKFLEDFIKKEELITSWNFLFSKREGFKDNLNFIISKIKNKDLLPNLVDALLSRLSKISDKIFESLISEKKGSDISKQEAQEQTKELKKLMSKLFALGNSLAEAGFVPSAAGKKIIKDSNFFPEIKYWVNGKFTYESIIEPAEVGDVVSPPPPPPPPAGEEEVSHTTKEPFKRPTGPVGQKPPSSKTAKQSVAPDDLLKDIGKGKQLKKTIVDKEILIKNALRDIPGLIDFYDEVKDLPSPEAAVVKARELNKAKLNKK